MTLSPVPSVAFELDSVSTEFVKTYQAKYDSRPKFPHFNGFSNGPWVDEMLKQDLVLKKDGEMWLRYAFWKPGEIEERTQHTYPHNARFDITPRHDDGAPSVAVIQWYEDGTAAVVYPEEFKTGDFTVSSWVPTQ